MPDVIVTRLRREHIFVPQQVADINVLLMELTHGTATPVTGFDLSHVLHNGVMFVAQMDDRTIGMATLVFNHIPTGLVGKVEDVVVKDGMRGAGVGKNLMGELIACARGRQLKRLDLTSSPRRVAAHALYKSLGFTVRDTTCFTLSLQ